MSKLQYILTLMFSLCIHGSIIAIAILLPNNTTEIQELVYRVSLAEFAIPSPVAVAKAQPMLDAQKTTPIAEPPKQKPTPKVEPRKIEPKMISAKKRTNVTKKVVAVKTQATPVQPISAQPLQAAVATPVSNNYGGLRAYKEDVVDQRPSISRSVAPKYPTRARRMNMQGQVIVRVIVDTSGSARQCTVHSSNPKDIFDEAALKAARKTRFIPGKVNGNKVNTVVLIPYKFTLR